MFSRVAGYFGRSRGSKDGVSVNKRARAVSYDSSSNLNGSNPQCPDSPTRKAKENSGKSQGDHNAAGGEGDTALREELARAALDPRKLEERKAEEKEFIRRNDTAEAHLWYLVDVRWLQEWKEFVTRKGPLPGPIDNSRLLERSGGQRHLQPVDDYRGVNAEVWTFWQSRYGGGPAVRRRHLDLYSSPVEDDELVSSEGSSGVGGNTATRRDRSDLLLPGSASGRAEPSARPGSGGNQNRSRDRGAPGTNRDAPRQDLVSSELAGNGDATGSSQRSSSRRGSGEAASARNREDARTDEDGALSSSNSRSSRAGALPASRGRTAERPAPPAAKRNSTSSRGASAPAGRVAEKAADEEPPKKLCCDRCDGPHETDKCPHFTKPREKHADAWSSYGKASRGDRGNEPVTVVRNARVVTQPADGSCLFHSLSYGLSDRSTASSLRREICGYIERNPDDIIADTSLRDWIRYDSGGTVNTYASRMSGGTWGGGIEMAALTKMKNVNVHVYEKCEDGFKRISAFQSPGASKTVSVLYQGRMHYDAIDVF
mmetsp:Transcript_134061/g.245908  ORF Transcript_134061/g.245908 Transcript_134061/m.245908 type:complete len:543 (-) Transcript_134061:34-1662(-)